MIGDRESKVNTYREFIFFDETQVVPEYTIVYRRQYEHARVPKHMNLRASGTTGRFWQVKLDKGFASIPMEANSLLLAAMKRGESSCEVEIADIKYTFDLENKEQINLTTGTKRKLRAPMVAP